MESILTPEEVINLPLFDKEINHHSRKRIGYHVYLSYYFKLISTLDYERKRQILVQCHVRDDDDAIYVDSTMTPRQPLCYEMTKAASHL